MNTQRYIAWRFLNPDQNSAGSFAELLLDKVGATPRPTSISKRPADQPPPVAPKSIFKLADQLSQRLGIFRFSK